MLLDVVTGVALGATLVVFALILWVVQRLITEARATGTIRKKKPTHILLVGIGTTLWGVVVLDSVSYAFLTDWAEAILALLGSGFLVVGLWKMKEFQQRVYVTLGGPGIVQKEQEEGDPSPSTRQAERFSRQATENRVLYAILFAGLIFGFAQTERQVKNAIESDRRQCERVNVLRLNQAGLLSDDIAARKDSLSRPLGTLEGFRKQIQAGVDRDERRLERIKKSVGPFAKDGDSTQVDCMRAHR